MPAPEAKFKIIINDRDEGRREAGVVMAKSQRDAEAKGRRSYGKRFVAAVAIANT